MSLTFAAIDVETANCDRGSVCSFGVVIVRNGFIVDRQHLLTRPPADADYFDPFNVSHHGITAADVQDQPRFADRLPQVLALIGALPVIAHNASFDIGAIRQGCDLDQLDWPTLTYGCSLAMSRRAELDLISYRLPLVCEALGIDHGTHHRADDDAQAAARIVLALAERRGAASLEELADGLMIRLGRITHTEWTGCIRRSMGKVTRPQANPEADPDHPLFGRHVSFTGALSVTRVEAWDLISEVGATPDLAPKKNTDFLVIGDGFNGTSAADFHTGKAAKAVTINAKGGRVEVLTEGDLWDMLAERATSGTRRAH